ncbi:DUF5999 family protein [Streptomyces sp. NPDC059679]|uniref:DUF5999 family protein n=1 Tax=Streptomyces sp. NPDC059679 TaxID=3346903 RepID=UPI0036BF815C
MMRPIRTARVWWHEVLGVVGVIEDITATVRSRRAVNAENKKLATAERTTALRQARQGCTHSPACPLATAPDRQRAAVVYEDDHFSYLCNGLVLSIEAIKAPDYPPTGLHEKESTL